MDDPASRRFALLLTVIVLADLVCAAINYILKPYETAFFEWGGYAAVAFVGWFWGRALNERLRRTGRRARTVSGQAPHSLSATAAGLIPDGRRHRPRLPAPR